MTNLSSANRLIASLAGFLGLFAVFAGLLGCGGSSTQPDDPRHSGVITTGNNGRVLGRVLAGGVGAPLEVRLLQETDSGVMVRAISVSDDSGAFAFPATAPGRYRVEAWWHGVLKGRSGTFRVDGDVAGIVVLVIGPTQLSLDLSSLEPLDSVFVDYPSNPGVRDGALWKVQVLRDSAFVLQTHRVGGRWEQWEVVSKNGAMSFRNLTDQRLLNFVRSVDTSAFLLTSHTTALWTFDSIAPDGTFQDMGRFGQNLVIGAAGLRNSPHGKALDGGALREGQIATTAGSVIPANLRWTGTGEQTIEVRFFLESLPPSGITLVGTKIGPQIMVSPLGALSVGHQVVPIGSSQPAWGTFTSFPGKIPLGRWVDLVVSVDQKDAQIYAWVGETPLDLFVEKTGGGITSLVSAVEGSFSVGGLPSDWRPGKYLVDEIRISDTLLFGKGNPIQAAFDASFNTGISMGGILRKAGVSDLCGNCQSVLLGTSTAGVEGAAYVRVEIPAQLKRARIVVANLVVWADVSENRSFGIYPLHAPWGASAVDGTGNWNAAMVDSLPHTVGPLFSGSTGGIVANITDLLQRWIDDPSSNHGVLIRANQLDLEAVNVYTGLAPSKTPRLLVNYR